MKKQFATLVACVVLPLSLGGCASAQAFFTSIGVSPATINMVQQGAIALCGFLPTIETVVGVLTGGGSVAEASAAQAICTALAQGQQASGMQVGRFGAPTQGAKAPANAAVGSTKIDGIYVR